MHLMTQAKSNVSALEFKRHLGVSYAIAWLLKHKNMQMMTLCGAERQSSGRVEIDDPYFGGKVQGGRAGRGSPDKIPFMAKNVPDDEEADPCAVVTQCERHSCTSQPLQPSGGQTGPRVMNDKAHCAVR